MARNGSRRAGDAATDSGSEFSNAAEPKRQPTPTQAPTRLVVRLELDAGNCGLSYRRLCWLLKALIRQHRIRCIAIGPDRGRP